MRSIGGLALYTLVNALQELDEESTAPIPRPHIVIDEYQVLAGQNIESLLALVASLASLYLAHQTSSQLSPSLNQLVWDNTFLKIIFTVSQEQDFRSLQLESQIIHDNWLEREDYGIPGGALAGGRPGTSGRSQYRDHLLTENVIRKVSKHKDLFLVVLDDGIFREPMICTRDHEVLFQDHLRDKHTPLDIVGAKFIGANYLGSINRRSPPWEARHAQPVEGERATWQAMMEAIWKEKMGPK